MNIFFYPEEKCSMNEFHEFQMFFLKMKGWWELIEPIFWKKIFISG